MIMISLLEIIGVCLHEVVFFSGRQGVDDGFLLHTTAYYDLLC